MAMAWKFTKEQTLEAIEGSFGIVSAVQKKLIRQHGTTCAWETARGHIDRWKETRQAFEGEQQRGLDLSESKMFEQINQGDGPMIRFHLSMKGRSRGYVQSQRNEVEHSGEVGMRIIEEVVTIGDGQDSPASGTSGIQGE
jgi:hypothetical protein